MRLSSPSSPFHTRVNSTMAMEVENASLCNIVIKYLLDRQYLLTAFELMHELIEDGHPDHATRLRELFSDADSYPPDEILRLQNLHVANPQRVVEERDAAEERATLLDYELRLAKEDIKRLQEKLGKHMNTISTSYFSVDDNNSTVLNNEDIVPDSKRTTESSLNPLFDPLHENERWVLNWAVKEYLLAAGYKLTAMTFYEEVDQDLDTRQTGFMYVPDALRRYYHCFLAASPEEIEEKERLEEEKKMLVKENEILLKSKNSLEQEVLLLKKSLEIAVKDSKDKEKKINDLKEAIDLSMKDLNAHRMEITSLKLTLESVKASKGNGSVYCKEEALPRNGDEQFTDTKPSLVHQNVGIESSKIQDVSAVEFTNDNHQQEDGAFEVSVVAKDVEQDAKEGDVLQFEHNVEEKKTGMDLANKLSAAESEHEDIKTIAFETYIVDHEVNQVAVVENLSFLKHETETVEILADSLPKIVPYVLINHREEILPLIMCAIERHPKSDVRDLLTHTLFNLIKRPDENQRRIIMDACLTLSKNIGEERTELELLPQCWEQINHKYEERRLLVAQSCGELAQFVKAEIRTSLILSIIQQLIEDPAPVVREAASHNLAILLPCIPNMDKYFKVEELMFQLLLDPSGIVVETTLKELVPAVVMWGKHGNQPLSQLLQILFSHILTAAQHCSPASGVEGSLDARLRVLGERERWNIDVLLRMLTDLLPEIIKFVRETCPYTDDKETLLFSDEKEENFFSENLIRRHLSIQDEWLSFDWLHVECLPMLLQLASMLPSSEDSLRSRLSKVLLEIIKQFGNHYLSTIMLPIFLTTVGDTADLSYFPASLSSQVKALKPKTDIDERLAALCILPLLLTGILGEPSMRDQLAGYLQLLVLEQSSKHGALSTAHTPEVLNAIRFLCIHEEHHYVIIGVLWELIVNSNPDVKISAARIMKVLVPHVDTKIASQDILPALVTLGSDPNLLVKYSSIEAFGAVAQHFKDSLITEKIRVQMDAFLEDGSHEATVAVIRTLAIAVPLMSSNLRDFLLQKLLLLTGMTSPGTTLKRRREKADAFCEAIRALDASDISATNGKDSLISAIQNLLKDVDALDPAHKEALELIMKERSGGRLEIITKAMGNHLNFTGVSSLFGETVFLAKKETSESTEAPIQSPQQPPIQEDTRLFNRFMRGNFGDMIRGKGQNQ